tara:strand:- start:1407 stop:3215 length:1809 start_codon:yes stop_codon:yes gene_type:complete
MCGYIGTFSKNKIDLNNLDKCNDLIVCRGPDEKKFINDNISNRFYSESKDYFSFIFNRLRILDFSNFSSQPMFSKEFNTSIMFNGEIFNHSELRKYLEQKGVKFYSDHSDTEVLLNGFSYLGISFVDMLIGQFSISFFNANSNELFLIRDRLGQKPLFYTYNNKEILFGSNLKSLVMINKDYKIDSNSLGEFLDLGVVTSPKTIFKDFYKVNPAEFLIFDLNNYRIKSQNKYWNIDEKIDSQKFDSNTFFNLFSDSIQSREVADVEIATYLSGGIDSSSIIKNMKDRNVEVNSFSVTYQDKKYDESKWSKLVAEKYSSNHQNSQLDNKEILNVIDKSIEIFDEPYADPSTVPSYILSSKISKKYKVAISGDGGDELLGGYVRTNELMMPNRTSWNFLNILDNFYPNFLGTGNNFKKYSNDLGYALESYFSDKNFLDILSFKYKSTFQNKFYKFLDDDYKSLLLTEYKFYLSEMMMLKIDRTSMANSLEIRSPFVDHRLVEYILSTSNTYYNENYSKSILKEYLKNDFDEDFLNRKKMGFVFNIENWIFNHLSDIKDTIKINSAGLNLESFNKLTIYKSRINANRIWKLFFLQTYLSSIDKLR